MSEAPDRYEQLRDAGRCPRCTQAHSGDAYRHCPPCRELMRRKMVIRSRKARGMSLDGHEIPSGRQKAPSQSRWHRPGECLRCSATPVAGGLCNEHLATLAALRRERSGR